MKDALSEPQTYSDERIDKISRGVYAKAMTAIERHFDKTQPVSSEMLQSLAAVADAASTCIKPAEEDGDDE